MFPIIGLGDHACGMTLAVGTGNENKSGFMVLFAMLVLLNFTVSTDLLFDFRLDVAGLPLNILDVLMVVIVLRQLFKSRADDFQADRVHPLLLWSLGLLLGAALMGVMGSTLNG